MNSFEVNRNGNSVQVENNLEGKKLLANGELKKEK